MPVARQQGHRLRSGVQTAANITSAYAIESFPNQTDQLQGGVVKTPWVAPAGMAVPEYVRVSGYSDGSARPDGYRQVAFNFSYWTFGMMGYFLTTYLPSGVYSAAISLMTYDTTDTAVYLTGNVYRPVIGKDMEEHGGGYKNIKLRFDTLIAAL